MQERGQPTGRVIFDFYFQEAEMKLAEERRQTKHTK